jgi:hypothetical protein
MTEQLFEILNKVNILEIIENQVFNLYENVDVNYDELKNNEFSSTVIFSVSWNLLNIDHEERFRITNKVTRCGILRNNKIILTLDKIFF